jgi:hypothetical protein
VRRWPAPSPGALGQEVRYNNVPPEVYRSLGFPAADDLGNMFQFKRDFNSYFTQWLAVHKDQIPLPVEVGR